MSEIDQHHFDLRQLSLQFALSGGAGQLLGWGIYESKWWRNFLHSHSYFELCFVHAGAGTFRHEGTVYAVSKGNLFLARPGEVHEIISAETTPLGIYFWSFTLHLTPTNSRPTHLVESFLRGSDVTVHAPHIEGVVALISAELTTLRPDYQTALHGLIHKLQIDTLRAFTQGETASQLPTITPFDPHAALVNDIHHFLQDNYMRRLRLRDIAAQIHLSERHANRLFKQATGKSVMATLTDIRLSQAKQHLLKPDLSITEIADSVGYDDMRYFSTLFRKRVGMTPSDFRKQRGTAFADNSVSE